MPVSPNPGLSPAVQEALQRRQPVPQLNQTSPQAPMQQQVPPPPNPSELDKTSAPPMTPEQPMMPVDSEAELIIKALVDRLKMKSKAAQQPAMGGGSAQNPTYSNKGYGGGQPQGYGGGGMSSRVSNFSSSSTMPKMKQQDGYPYTR